MFLLRQQLINDFSEYIHSFLNIKQSQISRYVENELGQGALWPEPLVQLIDELVEIGRLDARCSGIFRRSKSEATHGTYRTRDCILEIYDQMAAGHFVSPLDPPPAHGSRSSLAAKGGGSDDASATPNPLPNEERVQGEEGRRLSGGEMANPERASAETPPAPDLGASDDDSPLTLALPVGRVQYRVVMEATGEIKNFVSPPAQVEE